MHRTDERHPAARAFRRLADPSDVLRLERRIVQARHRRAYRRAFVPPVASATVLVILICAIGYGPGWHTEPAARAHREHDAAGSVLKTGWAVNTARAERFAFEGLVRLELAPHTELHIMRSNTDLVNWRLDIGRMTLFTDPLPSRVHRIDTAHGSITMIAAHAEIAAGPNKTTVTSYKGKVGIERPGDSKPILLDEGETVRLEPASTERRSPPSPPPPPSRRGRRKAAPANDASTLDAPLSQPDSASGRTTPPSNAEQPTTPLPDASHLLEAADAATGAGRHTEAEALLNELLESFPEAEEAPYAAFSLGMLYLQLPDRQDDARGAFQGAIESGRLPAALKAIAERHLQQIHSRTPTK